MRERKWYGVVPAIAAIAMLVVPSVVSAQSVEAIRAAMGAMNAQLEAMGYTVRIETVEYYTVGHAAGQIVHFEDRAKQMDSHWVPGDPRRGGFTDIAWLSDQTEGAATSLTLAQTQTATSNAMVTWDGVKSTYIPLTQLPDLGIDWGLVQWLAGLGGINGWWADITHAGWLPGIFFDIVGGPGGSTSILGITFTFVWIDGSGNLTDIDNNRKSDVAFREIYYNNWFPWGINTSFPIDVETVVLHETGHGLSQDHFGKLFSTEANGILHFAPRAVMNAGYTGVQQVLTGTDRGGHNSIWASWPLR